VREEACGYRSGSDANDSALLATEPADRRYAGPGVCGDFQVDATTDGRPVKIVSIVDEHTRECPGGRVDRSPGMLVEELDRLSGQRGYRAVLRCDNGRELACAAMADQAGEGVGLAFIPPG
jgi:hypothetical protein